MQRNLLQYCHLDVVNHIDVCNSIVEAFLYHSAVAFCNGAAEQVAEHICDGIQEVGGAACHAFAELRSIQLVAVEGHEDRNPLARHLHHLVVYVCARLPVGCHQSRIRAREMLFEHSRQLVLASLKIAEVEQLVQLFAMKLLLQRWQHFDAALRCRLLLLYITCHSPVVHYVLLPHRLCKHHTGERLASAKCYIYLPRSE